MISSQEITQLADKWLAEHPDPTIQVGQRFSHFKLYDSEGNVVATFPVEDGAVVASGGRMTWTFHLELTTVI